MRRLEFHYAVLLRFERAVERHQFALRFVPRSDEVQRIDALTSMVDATGDVWEGVDGFGNVVLYGQVLEQHDNFMFRLDGEASVFPGFRHDPVHPAFRHPTALTRAEGVLADVPNELMAALDGQLASPESVRSYANAALAWTHGALAYRKDSTTVETTAAQAAQGACGVCQDYAHVLLALLRARKIACRYIVGMMVGEGATHAWVEYHDGEAWIALDPTNGRAVDDGYVVLSFGRDFGDCRINRGVLHGGGKQEQAVHLHVSDAGIGLRGSSADRTASVTR